MSLGLSFLFHTLYLLGAIALSSTENSLADELSGRAEMTLVDFDSKPERGKVDTPAGGYPSYYDGRQGSRGEGGIFTSRFEQRDSIKGRSLELHLTAGALYAQFNPYGRNGTRGFARDYCIRPRDWHFNTYNRLSFWIKLPATAVGHSTLGQANFNVGTYVKTVRDSNPRSDESGGNHYYHAVNIFAVGEWTQVILNMHPDHCRGESGNEDPGDLPHPTGENRFNYFDALTRFYIEENSPPASYPASYLLDEFKFYREQADENDQQVYSLTATYVAANNRLLVGWRRHKRDTVPHEVRYDFEDIHRIGWESALAAPDGRIMPPGDGGYNGMIFDTTVLPLRGQSRVYVAIRPERATKFSQVVIPLRAK